MFHVGQGQLPSLKSPPVLYSQVPPDRNIQDLLGSFVGCHIEQTCRDCRALITTRFHGDFTAVVRCVQAVDWAALNGPGKPAGSLEPRDQALLWEMVLFGDGGAFVDRIVTPVFRALAFEVSTKGGKGVEAAMRITYDDANECFVLPQNVERIIQDVGWCGTSPLGMHPFLPPL